MGPIYGLCILEVRRTDKIMRRRLQKLVIRMQSALKYIRKIEVCIILIFIDI